MPRRVPITAEPCPTGSRTARPGCVAGLARLTTIPGSFDTYASRRVQRTRPHCTATTRSRTTTIPRHALHAHTHGATRRRRRRRGRRGRGVRRRRARACGRPSSSRACSSTCARASSSARGLPKRGSHMRAHAVSEAASIAAAARARCRAARGVMRTVSVSGRRVATSSRRRASPLPPPLLRWRESGAACRAERIHGTVGPISLSDRW